MCVRVRNIRKISKICGKARRHKLSCFTLSSVLYAYNHLNSHCCRQGAAPGASARVLAAVAEHLDQGVRASVNDAAMAAEIRSAIHDANDFDHLVHTVKLPIEVVRDCGEQPQRSVAASRQHARARIRFMPETVVGSVRRDDCFCRDPLRKRGRSGGRRAAGSVRRGSELTGTVSRLPRG